MASPEDQLAAALERLEDDFLVVVTGAGISAASGIPTFRGSDPDAIWKRDPTELATYRYFREDPVDSWRWYMSRFKSLIGARPNPAHLALTAIERWQLERGGRYLLVTQNIDTLHEQAGAREMVKVHGTSDRVRCPRPGCRHGAPRGSLARQEIAMEPFAAAPSMASLPRCPECGDVLRPHVLWFDEFYSEHEDYQWERVQEAAYRMSFGLFVGTSFSVGMTDMFLQAGLGSGVPIYSIDPAGSPLPVSGLNVLAAKAEELLPAVCGRLGIELG
ncbi:MAG: Sir2 family NAD-dependent protein deacetylase [Thermoanaerobaculia bacterium]